MTEAPMAAQIIDALELPRSARVDQRVAKKLLVENGAVTATDKRRINEGIESLIWIAALKPHTIGVPAYRDDVREYLEIAVLSLELRPNAKTPRLLELVHRAIPYPLFVVSTHSDLAGLSVAHKRHAENEAAKVVLDDSVIYADVPRAADGGLLLPSLNLASQPRGNLYSVYQGWIECVEATQAAQITGMPTMAENCTAAEARRAALADYRRIVAQIATIRSRAERESQVAHRVELNMELKRLESQLAEAKNHL